MIKDPTIEFQPLEEIIAFQEEKLQSALQYLKAHSPFYQKLFQEEQIEIEAIKTIEQLQLIPFTEKSALHEHNKEFLCTPKERIIDYITTSGTSGDPVTFAMSDRDLERLAYNEAISFMGTGSKPGDIFQLMTTIDKRFMAGLAYFLGVRMLGAGIIRVGNGIPELQWDTIRRINPDTLIVVPSFILKIIQYAEENNIDYHQFGVKKAICIGENLREQDFSLNLLGQKIKDKWDIELYSTYASTEMSTSFTECTAQKGGHLHPELIICELIDDEGNVVKEGEYGELVVTTLGVEAMPLLRYKTGDMCRFHYEPCSCGRNTPRISPIIGRKNQMIKFKGTTLYPYAIFDVLEQISYVENYLVYVSTNEIGTDQLTVKVGTRTQSEEMEKEIKDKFRARLRVAPEVIFESIETIQKIQTPEIKRKPIKFFDERK
ncbi:MAG: AMP-binding protein [Bacteroidales bacterium]|jgi:phenylacetate-CoA ligase|nr:AMP-binding protein [Bacteroidales bacterium]HHT52138.1 phenylacetate--CoA ligase [Bacteroidales bacterium]